MIGTRIGNYEIVGQAGHGGMGVVYEARHVELGSRAAIKSVLSREDGPAPSEDRLRDEARMAASVDHPYVCRVFDLAEHDSQLYIVMEYVTGETLSQRLRDDSLDDDDRLRVTSELAEALAAIHEAGLIHGDLKPSNVMVGRDGHIKVMDFGLARRAEAAISLEVTRSMTSTETNRPPGGTLPYMAPELMHGTPPSARSDMWALGVVAHEVWTGKHPFLGPTLATTAARVIGPEPSEAQLRTAFVKHPWRQSLGACLARDARRRPATARDLIREVSRSGPTIGVSAQPARSARRSLLWFAAVPLVLMAAAVATWILVGGASTGPRVAVIPLEGQGGDDTRRLAMLSSAYLGEIEQSQVIPFYRIRPLLAQMDPAKRNDLAALRTALGAETLIGIDLEAGTSPMVGVFRMLHAGEPEQSFTHHGSSIASLARQASVDLAGRLGIGDGSGSDDGPSVYTEFPDAIRRYDQAQALRDDLRYADALEALDEAIEIDPDFLAARVLRAQTNGTIGLTDVAKAEVQEIREAMQQAGFSPTGRWSRYVSALHARYHLKPEKALVELQSLCDADPTDLVACPMLVDALDVASEHGEALALIDGLLAEYPMDLDLRLERITTLAELGRYDDALQEADRLEDAAQLLSLSSLGGFLAERRGYVEYRQGNFDASFDHYETARERYTRDGLELLAAGPLKSTADTYIQMWRLDEAREKLERALLLARTSGNLGVEVRILNSLGAINYRQRRPNDALSYYAQADELARRLGAYLLRRSPILNSASSFILLGDLDRARRQLSLATELAEQHADERVIPNLLIRESDLARAAGRFDEAAHWLTSRTDRFEHPGLELTRYQRLLQVKIEAEASDAAEVAESAVASGRELGQPARLAYTIDLAAVVASRSGDLDRAERLLDESRGLYEESPHGPIHTLTHEWATVEQLAARERWAEIAGREFDDPVPGHESLLTHVARVRALRQLGRLDEAQAVRGTLVALPWLTDFERGWVGERIDARP